MEAVGLERLWVGGAFITSLLISALLAQLLFLYVRYRSRLAIAFIILLSGALLHLMGELDRILQNTYLIAGSSYSVFALLTACGAGLMTFGLPNIAVDLTSVKPTQRLKVLMAFFAAATAVLAARGILNESLTLLGISYLMESCAGLAAALIILDRRMKIQDIRIRRLVTLISLLCGIFIPASIFRLFYRFFASDGLADAAPPFTQLLLLDLMLLSTLIFGGRFLYHRARTHRVSLDREALEKYGISPRERDIIILVNEGLTGDEIASRLSISSSTVKNHIYHVYRKTEVHNRVELLNLMMQKE